MKKKEHLGKVINSGLDMMKSESPEFSVWCDYALKVLEIISENKAIVLNFLDVKYAAETRKELTDKERLSMCLRYLIEIKELF